jgi:hypothetical protein
MLAPDALLRQTSLLMQGQIEPHSAAGPKAGLDRVNL